MTGFEGRMLGPYRVIAQAGVGGMAKIYKAYQPSMDRTVALKVLPEQYAQDPQFVERFTREARTIAQLEHRNILPVYDFGEQDGVAYLVMRYLEGGTLKELLDQRRLSFQETGEILGQVAAALDYAHRRGVIHRDVKPSNVLIDREGAVFLSDFGIAKVLESSSYITQTGTTLGTPAYMSPEQCVGATVDKRSDIYSLGVVLYEMVAGRVPFQADTPMAVLLAHLHEPLPMPQLINPQIPDELQAVILKAMAKKPEDRYATAAEMGANLRQAIPPEPLEATRIVTPSAEPPAAVVHPEAEALEIPPTPAAGEAGVIEQPEEGKPEEEVSSQPVEAEAALASGEQIPQETAAAPTSAEEFPPETMAAPAGEERPPTGTEAVFAPQASLQPQPLPDEQTQVEISGSQPAREETRLASPAREKPAPASPATARPRRKWLLLLAGLAVVVVLLAAGLVGGFAWLLRNRAVEATPTSLAAVFTSTSRPSPTSPPRPTNTTALRMTATPRPQPTNTQRPEPQLWDDFRNPEFEGRLNPELWEPVLPDGCQVAQTEGMLSIGNQPLPDLLDCSAWMKTPPEPGGILRSMEASFLVEPNIVGDGSRTALAWVAELPETERAGPGLWLVKCGIVKEKEMVARFWITDSRMGEGEFAQSVYTRAEPYPVEAWMRLRLQVEPETMTFSCWLGDHLLGMYNPVSEGELLHNVVFRPYLLSVHPPQARMTVKMTELVFLPPEVLPRAAELAQPAPGCLPPPDGIVGWWSGDGTLDNLVFPQPGGAEGAWGFARGMVGQAIAFQNFPSRVGLAFFPPYPALENLENVTVEGWVQIDHGPFPRIDRFLTLGPETLVIRHDGNEIPGTLHFYMRINGELQHLWSERLLRAGVFQHVAGTYDGNMMKLYLNGTLVASRSVKGEMAREEATVGLSGGEAMDGLLDEMTLYNRALTAEEIKVIYEAREAGKCRP